VGFERDKEGETKQIAQPQNPMRSRARKRFKTFGNAYVKESRRRKTRKKKKEDMLATVGIRKRKKTEIREESEYWQNLFERDGGAGKKRLKRRNGIGNL